MKVLWYEDTWKDYCAWQQEDKKTLKRINVLIKEMQRAVHDGIGKPEPLKGKLSGWWSRRIDHSNRIVYKEVDGVTIIAACKGHYEDLI